MTSPDTSIAPPAPRGQDLAALMQALAVALVAIREGRSWTLANAQTPAHLHAGVQALGFTVLRHLGRAQALRDALAPKPPPPMVDALLCAALALLVAKEAPYPPHTLLDQTVQAAKLQAGAQSQAGFINACLRRFLRERQALMQYTDEVPSARWNYPDWWLARLRQDHAQKWQRVAQQGNQPAPLQLRVNTLQTSQAQLLDDLTQAGVAARAFGSSGLELERHGDVRRLPGYAEGHFSVQDAAAQIAAPLLLAGLSAGASPLRVLDACAAPGGKAAHLLQYAAEQQLPMALCAVELDEKRAERISENLTRLQLPAAQDMVEVVVQDALQYAQQALAQGVQFDAILLDAPCTASGIVRRHPDVPWLRRESDVTQLGRQQGELLRALWPLLPLGGRMLYCVCSVFHAEGQGQIAAFLTRNTDAHLLPSPGHLNPGKGAVQTRIQDNEASDASSSPSSASASWEFINTVSHDGFYYALLEKRARVHLDSAAAAASVLLDDRARTVLRATGPRPKQNPYRRPTRR